MRALKDICEGLLDVDFDISEDVLTIQSQTKRIKNDLFLEPNKRVLGMLPKLINPDLPLNDEFGKIHHDWTDWQLPVRKLLSWIATRPMAWLKNYEDGEFYVDFLNRCLTPAGSKKKWKVWVGPIKVSKSVEIGRRVAIEVLSGQSWVPVAVLAAYT